MADLSIMNVQDPGDPNATGAFPGTSAASQLYGVSPLLAAIPVDIGPKTLIAPDPVGVNVDVPDMVHLDKAVAHVYGMDPAALSQTQKRMWDAGLFPKTTYREGYTAGFVASGDETDQAWNRLVDTAAKSRKSINQVLDDGISKINEAGGLEAAGFQVGPTSTKKQAGQITGAVDLAHFAQQVAKTMVGRELPPDQLSQFIADYQAKEGAGTAGSTSTDIGAATEAFLQAKQPQEVMGQRMLSGFNRIMQLVGQTPPLEKLSTPTGVGG